MQINSLELITFRNYENEKFEFKQNNLIIGLNGTGKTTILEAIDILASTKSKIVKGINKCIKKNFNGFIITAKFSKDNGQELKIVFRQERRKKNTIKVNEEILERSSQLLGKVNSVIFLPQDIEIIQGSPQTRRKYLDILISQIDSNYFQKLQKYSILIKQRNKSLKDIKEKRILINDLDIWDEQLARLMTEIFSARQQIIEALSEDVLESYQAVGFQHKLNLTYLTTVTKDPEKNLENIKKEHNSDIITGHTGYGVHRDDFIFTIKDNPAQEYASQGQQRLIVLCLKLAEARLKQQTLKDEPILLIDDVLLELDLERFNSLIEKMLGDNQKIFTVTDTKRFKQELLNKLKLIELKG